MFARDVDRPFELTVTNGAVDATEKLLAQALTPGEPVALEDPCFLTSINAVRRAGYRPVSVEIDADGMLPEALSQALADGARAVVCTPRAHNPTGASLTEERARALRAVLADHPHVLVIEDDHFSALARTPYRSIIPDDHRRWALIRSFSKILGPDLRVGVVASDPDTAQRFTAQIGAGSTWVSHLLQRTVHALVTDDQVEATVEKAAQRYAARNDAFVAGLAERGIDAFSTDGVNVWVDTGPVANAHGVHTQLMLRGWVARTGDSFALSESTGATNLRLTVHQLDDAGAEQLAQALADAIAAAQHAHA
jgi:DNA-binding transcriptional MocR family regulator